MEIIIEIGTPEQKKQIRNELEIFPKIGNRLKKPLTLNKIIVPKDFAQKVNELSGSTSYKSKREIGDSLVVPQAKIVEQYGGINVVLSPQLYTGNHDASTRYFVIVHELTHVINKKIFPELPHQDFSTFNYLQFLYWLFDEYTADCSAYKVIDKTFPEVSNRWKTSLESSMEGYEFILLDEKNIEFIRNEIAKFRMFEIDVNQFTDNIKQMCNDLAVATIHAYSQIHNYPSKYSEEKIVNSIFVNRKTLNLIDYIRHKYNLDEFDLDDGLQLVSDYMTNFGFRFEQRSTGPYCHVLDI